MTSARRLRIIALRQQLAIARLDPVAQVPAWALQGKLVFVCRTPTELSVVCEQEDVPSSVQAVRGWSALMVEGPLDLAMTGILASIAVPLGQQGIPIYAVSTFDTDYVLVRSSDLDRAVQALVRAGFDATYSMGVA